MEGTEGGHPRCQGFFLLPVSPTKEGKTLGMRLRGRDPRRMGGGVRKKKGGKRDFQGDGNLEEARKMLRNILRSK